MEAAIVAAGTRRRARPGRPPFDSIRVVSSLSWRTATRRGSSPSASARRRASSPTPPPAATPRRRSSTARRWTSSPATRHRRARRRRGVADADAGPQDRAPSSTGPKAPEDQPPGDDRRRPRHDPPRRGRARRVPAGADVPDVRDGDPRRRRAAARRAPGRRSASCGPASARSPPATRRAWIREAKTAEEIRTTSPQNRIVGLPYRKYMNSNNDVDMAAAVIMCSVEAAAPARRRRGPLGVPARRHRLPRARLRVQPRHVRPHAGHRARRRAAPSSSPASASTTSPSSTCTRASRRPCSSARSRSGCRPTASSPAPAAWPSPADRGTTT